MRHTARVCEEASLIDKVCHILPPDVLALITVVLRQATEDGGRCSRTHLHLTIESRRKCHILPAQHRLTYIATYVSLSYLLNKVSLTRLH